MNDGFPRPNSIIVNKMVPQAQIVSKANPHAVGFDIANLTPMTIPAQSIGVLNTGIRAFPKTRNLYLRVAGRSGLTASGYLVQTGVIDPDYFGEIKVIMFNSTRSPVHFKQGARIAQLIPEIYASFCRMDEITNDCFDSMTSRLTDQCSNVRGVLGFGSSGI